MLIFWNSFPKQGILPSENRKNEHHNWILHIQISLGIKFYFEQIVLSFMTKFAQNKYLYSKTKSQHDHWILHIQISVGTKFQLKVKILIFCTKFAQKGYFQSKMEKFNITIAFCIFELLWVQNFMVHNFKLCN